MTGPSTRTITSTSTVRSRIECDTYNCTDYRGTQNKTRSGHTCKNWSTSSYWSNRYTNHGLGDHNNCRNPDSDSDFWCLLDSATGRWWEFCEREME